MIYDRYISDTLDRRLKKPFVDVLFGARQTGKTSLLRTLLAPALTYNLADPAEKARLSADPGAFRRECEALPATSERAVVFVDEAQTVPSVFDSVQALYDTTPERWKFVLCGSSARKMRHARHLRTFLDEQPAAEEGFVVCRCPRPQKLSERITAIPWHRL